MATSLVDQFKELMGWMNASGNSNTSMFRSGSSFGGGMSNPNFVQGLQVPMPGQQTGQMGTYNPGAIPSPDDYIAKMQPVINQNRDMQTNAAMARLGKSGMGGMGTPVIGAVSREFGKAANEMGSIIADKSLDAWKQKAQYAHEGQLDDLSRKFQGWQTGMGANTDLMGLENQRIGMGNDRMNTLVNLLGTQQSGQLSRLDMMGGLARDAAPWGMLDVDPEEASRRAQSLFSQFNSWL